MAVLLPHSSQCRSPRRSALLLALLTSACSGRACGEGQQPTTTRAAPTDAREASAPAPQAQLRRVAFAPDGSLVVERAGKLVATNARGLETTYSFPPDVEPTWSPRIGRSVAIVSGTDARLVALNGLREIARVKGRAISGAILAEGDDAHDVALHLARDDDRTVRIEAPSAGGPYRGDEIALTKSGAFAVVVWKTDDAAKAVVVKAYALADGKETGDALPLKTRRSAPASILHGDRQIGFRGEDLVDIDLATGKTLRTARLPCAGAKPGDHVERGNPVVDASGTRLVVTCGSDGFLLDAKTLRVQKRYPSLLPACDQSGVLSTDFEADASLFVILACDAEARLELATGKYRCADGDGLMPKPANGVEVPRCNAESLLGTSVLVVSPHWTMAAHESGAELRGPGGAKLILPYPADIAISPAEDRVAYIDNGTLVVRSLPDGKAL